MARSEGYVSADYLRKVAEVARAFKQRSYDLMDIRSGQVVLDAGCGPGIDTVPLAERVGVAGRVVGIDIDEEMLAQADDYSRSAGVQSRVEHRKADITRLPFADGVFDAVRAERLFQVLPKEYAPITVLTELARVLKSGGRLVLSDADWGTASVDYPDGELERRLMTFFAQRMRPNGFAGRQFLRLLVESGFSDVEVEIHPFAHRDYEQTPFGDWLIGEAVNHKVATAVEMGEWKRHLTERNGCGEFFASVNMIIVSGKTR